MTTCTYCKAHFATHFCFVKYSRNSVESYCTQPAYSLTEDHLSFPGETCYNSAGDEICECPTVYTVSPPTRRRRLLSHDPDADAAKARYGPGYVTVTITPLHSSVGAVLWRYTLQNSGYMLTEQISGLTQGVNISRNISVIRPGNLVDFEFLPLLNDCANIQPIDQLCPWEYISNTGANWVDMNQYSDLRIKFTILK